MDCCCYPTFPPSPLKEKDHENVPKITGMLLEQPAELVLELLQVCEEEPRDGKDVLG